MLDDQSRMVLLAVATGLRSAAGSLVAAAELALAGMVGKRVVVLAQVEAGKPAAELASVVVGM